MSRPPYPNQGGSDFGGTTCSNSTRFEDRELSHENPHRDQEPRGQKRKHEDDQKQVDQNRYHVLLESLRFNQIDARFANIKTAHGKTCKWLLDRPEYLDWLNPDKAYDHHGFLWVKGKPGAGKSTLMKFILNNARTRMKDRVVISFFFNTRGEILEKSTVGMYRSLLLQLLERLPRLQHVLDPTLVSGMNENHNWRVESLKEIFEQAVQNLEGSPLVIFIDALDECDEPDIRDMISFLEDLGNVAVSAGTIFQVCFASRHYPHITMPRKIELVIEGQEGHEQDIVSYLDNKLRIGNNKTTNDIHAEVKEKACGVFLWVILMAGMLQREYHHGRKYRLKQKLREIPRDLHEFFREMLTRDDENKDRLLLCIQWLLFARQALKPEQLYFAIRAGEDWGIDRWDRREMPESTISKFVLSVSKGLVETRRSRLGHEVQFIHESVRDFLLKDHGLEDVWPHSSDNLEAESHQRLKQICSDYITAFTSFLETSPKEAPVAPDTAGKDFPFLRYAVQNVLHHANAAEEHGISQKSFIRNFPLTDWINLDNFIEESKVYRHTPEASLLYVLAEHNLSHLIGCSSSEQSSFQVERQRYGAPILAALATGSHAAVWRLMKVEAEREPLASPLHALCNQYRRGRDRQARIGRDFKYTHGRTLLSYLVQNGDEALVSFALALDKPTNLEERTEGGRTILSLAASVKSSVIVQMLLDIGALLATADKSGRTPLSHAAESCDEATVRLLIAKGARIEEADCLGLTPLSRAISSSSSSASKRGVLQLLLNHATIDRLDYRGQSPLMHATMSSDLDTMKLLIDRGADIDTPDINGKTPLAYAVSTSNNEDVVRLLLRHGAAVNMMDSNGQTPLLLAAERGCTALVQVLVEAGAYFNTWTVSGDNPLFNAVASGHEAVAMLLLDNGAIIENQGAICNTPLHSASQGGYESLTMLLIEHGANIESRNNEGETCLFSASRNGNEAIVRLLIKHGANIESRNNEGETCLFIASRNGNEAVLRLLIEHGANIESRNNEGETCLFSASRNGNEAIVRLLVQNGTDVHTVDKKGLTAVMQASKTNQLAIVDILTEDRARTSMTRNVTAAPLTDSGYASTSAFNRGFEKDPTSRELATDLESQLSTNRPFSDRAPTVYSDVSTTTASSQTHIISELAHYLAREVRATDINKQMQARVAETMPDLLKSFALSIGHETSSQMHRDVMVFVHKSRRQIGTEFVNTLFSQEQEIPETDTTDLGSTNGKAWVSEWMKRTDFQQAPLEEHDESTSYHPIPANDQGPIEEADDDEDETESRLQKYRGIIFEAPALKWLLARLHNELYLCPMEPHSKESIGQRIISVLPSPPRISKKTPFQSCIAKFEVDWDVLEFFQSQEYSKPSFEAFKHVITLTGSSSDAQAATCVQYLGQTWPCTAVEVVDLMERVIIEKCGNTISSTLPDGTTICVSVRNSRLLAEMNGTAATIAEIGEQLAWLGAALRTSPERTGLFQCTPVIISIEQSDVSLFNSVEVHPSSPAMACKIGFTTEKIPISPDTNGRCWQTMFKSPMVVRGYPIPERVEWGTGLEIPLNIMARLGQTPEVQRFRDKICLKGFSTMLVPIRRRGDTLFWHLLYNKDGTRVSYLDNKLNQEPDVTHVDILQIGRHVLGWCSKSKVVISKIISSTAYNTILEKANVAGPCVKHSMLGKPKSYGALTGICVWRRRLVPRLSTVQVGARDSPQLYSAGYTQLLQFLQRKFVLLWDKDDDRGWLVSGTVALLLVLRVFLTGPYKSAIICKTEDLKMLDKPLNDMTAFEVLNNLDNQSLLLYNDGTCLKSKIYELCGLLEQLIEHQTAVSASRGNRLSQQPRRDLEGWELDDVAGMEQDPLHPRATEIEPHGKGWVDFTRAIEAVTLFGRGFGEIIQPNVRTCARWKTLPTGRYFIAVCVSDLKRIFRKHGSNQDGHVRLSDDLFWHTPPNSEFCRCTQYLEQDSCEPVQTVFLLDPKFSESVKPRGDSLPEEGALIFGHSSIFPWIWDDVGEPRSGHLNELASKSLQDSGIGSSLTSSEVGTQVPSFSRSGGSYRKSSSGTMSSPRTPVAPGIAPQVWPQDCYKVGILCALEKEMKAVRALFDESHGDPLNFTLNWYTFGRIGHQMIVARCLANCGTNEAGLAAKEMEHIFPLEFCLLVGIGGGVPSERNDIRLGDVVVGTEVIQYDLGHRLPGSQFVMKKQPTLSAPKFLLNTISNRFNTDPDPPEKPLRRLLDKSFSNSRMPLYRHQGQENDKLFETCLECGSSEEPCSQSRHTQVQRKKRETDEPKIHYGKIASGNQVVKDAKFRDDQAKHLDIQCFEMEAAGVAIALPCLVIRGICDYCDVYKNDDWQEYAAATAAAYAKLLLTSMNKRGVPDDLSKSIQGPRKRMRGPSQQ